jgi:hypothetical protein
LDFGFDFGFWILDWILDFGLAGDLYHWMLSPSVVEWRQHAVAGPLPELPAAACQWSQGR